MGVPQNYYFLLYKSDPRRERALVYVDGDEHALHISHQALLDLITSTAGCVAIPDVRHSLNTYGTFWLYDRDKNQVQHLSPGQSEDIINLRKEITSGKTLEEQPGNLTDGLVGVEVAVPELDNIKTSFDTPRTKKKTFLGITLPTRK